MPGKGRGSKSPEPSQLPLAPTYHPTEEEFANPLAFIARIRPEAEAYGACKIVPPAGWQPPFVLDRRSFRFKTRVQSVHELQERSTAEEEFEEDYHKWMKAENKAWKGYPMVNGREVDLYKLYRVVQRRGGYDSVCEKKAWKELCRILQVRDKSGNAAYTVRQLYQKHLLPYDEHCAKRSVQQKPAARAKSPEQTSAELSNFDRMVAAANGKEDMDLLGAVAALMDVPASEGISHTCLKLDQAAKETIRVPSNIYTMVCELCKGGHREDQIILCDKCDRGCHMFCLQPPLTEVPEGEWTCPLCVAEEVDTRAFREGNEYSLDQFERLAKEFKVTWFGSQAAADKATPEDIERAFWDVVEEGEEPVEVMYGADLDTSVFGSGFPVRAPDGSLPEAEVQAQYAASPWNLNNLPRLEGSLLRHLDNNIAGVTLPWMYMGMMFSSFCWHIEDHMFYSINYHHWGDPKRWYSVPSSAAEAFEAAFRDALPELFEKQPDVLFHLVTMLSPRILQAAGVPVYAVSQEPGEFVVTFPCAYHGGFNMGLNCAEAVNFAPSDWLRFGAASVERFRTFRKQPILSHSWLLLKVAEHNTSDDSAYWAEKDLRRVVAEEREWRCRLQRSGCYQARRVEQPVGMLPGAKDDVECAICHSYLHLSAVECKCCPKRYVCLHHADNLCECPPSSWRLAYRHSLAQLETFLTDLATCVPQELRLEPHEHVPNVNGNLADSNGSRADMDVKMEEADPEASPAPEEAGQPAGATPKGDTVDWVEHTAEPCSASREPSGNLARTVSADLGEALPPPRASKENPVGVSPTQDRPTIPRKRDRKAKKDRRSVKKSRFDEPEERPQIRVTRAAIKAEEEAQDTMDVLSALTGLADMVGLDAQAREPSVTPEASPDPAPVSEAGEGASVQPGKSGSRAISVGAAGLVASLQHHSPGALTDDFDVSKAMADLRELHRSWLERCNAVFEKGGAKAGEVEALVQQSQQFMWADADLHAGVPELVVRLKEAQAWAHKVHGFLKNKPGLEEVEAALQCSPPPIPVPGLSRLVEGRSLACNWLQRVAELASDKQIIELRVLENTVSEGQRLPFALPELKVLKERMIASRQLLDAVRAALPSYRTNQPVAALPPPEKMRSRRKRPASQEPGENPAARPPPLQVQDITLEWLRILRTQANSLRVRFLELDQLCTSIAAIEAFQAKTKEVLQVKPTLSALRELVLECDNMSVSIPEMHTVQRLMAEAKTWLNKAKGVTQARTPLKRMREILHAGLRLGTELPQVEELRQEIRKREWEDNAKKALTNKQTITALKETLEDAAAMGAEQTDLAEGIRNRLAAARAWDEEAARFFGAPGRAPLSALEELVDSGNALGVRMDRLVHANQALHAAVSWAHRADEAGSADHRTPPEERPSLIEVEALLVDYQALVVALPEADSLTEKRDEAQAWARQAQRVLAEPLTEDRTHEFERMVVEGWSTGVQMDELGALQDCLAALEWTKRVRRFRVCQLKARPTHDTAQHQPDEPSGCSLSAATDPTHTQPGAVGEGHAATDTSAMHLQSDQTANPMTQPHLAGQPQPDLAGQPQPADHPQPVIAPSEGATAASGAPAEPQTVSSLPSAQGASKEGTEHRGKEFLGVEEAQQLLEEGEHLPVDQEILAGLRHNLQLVHDWETRLSAISQSQAGGEQAGTSPDVLLPLVEEARGMALQPESLPALEDALAKAAVWQARAARLFKDGGKPHFAEVSAIALSGRALLVQAEASQQVEAVVTAGEAWRESCRRLMAKRNSGQRLGKCVKIVTTGLERAVEQLQLRMQEEATRPAKEEQGSPSAANQQHEYEENERDLYCVCQQPYNVDTAMISCDNCEEWYHCRCIGLTQTTARSIKKYICPVCLAVRGSEKELEQALARTRRTRRPLPESVRAAVAEADGLPCIMEEAEALNHTLALYDRWRNTATSLICGHEQAQLVSDPRTSDSQQAAEPLPKPENAAQPMQASVEVAMEEDDGGIELGTSEALDAALNHDVAADLDAMEDQATGAGAGAGAGPSESQDRAEQAPRENRCLSVKTLGQLVKTALSMELDIGSLQGELLNALKLQRWRTRAEAAIKPNNKYTVDGLSKLVKEGEIIGIKMDQDRIAWPLVQRSTIFSEWLERAQDVVQQLVDRGDDKELVSQNLKVAHELLERGTKGLGLPSAELPRGFDKELGRLEEACKLYCLCQQPYNEDRPMLGCDYCQDWFHYDCVGLRAPSEDEDDEDVAPKDYRCPACCCNTGIKYPDQEKLPIRSLEALGIVPKPAEMANNSGRELATHTGASRLHELLTPSQAQALGEAQQAMLIGGIRPPPQQHSWLLNVLAQQQRLRPPASLAQQSFSGPPTTGVSSGLPTSIMLSNYQPIGQSPGSYVLPQMPQAPPAQQGFLNGIGGRSQSSQTVAE